MMYKEEQRVARMIRKHIIYSGHVQGVGFRWRAKKAAEMYDITGWVRNDRNGTVSMEVQGTEEQIEAVILAIQRGMYIRIDHMDSRTIPVDEKERGFRTEYD